MTGRWLALAPVIIGAAQVASASETVSYQYDAESRIVKVIRTGSVNNGVTTQYTHDQADNRRNVKTTGSTNSPPN